MATTEPAGLWKKGDFIALLRPDGTNITRTIRRIDELMPLLSRDELEELRDWIAREQLMNPNTDPEHRREILSTMDTCPCCLRWLGHNRPPGDTPQAAFDFER